MRPTILADNRRFVKALRFLTRAVLLLCLVLVACPTADCLSGQGLQAEEISVDQADAASESQDDGFSRRDALIASVTIFVLAIFVGIEVITKVPPTLHTPLMSGSNAISGITLVGALLATGAAVKGDLLPVLGTLAVVMATINVVGGFLVTHRMLSMFRRK